MASPTDTRAYETITLNIDGAVATITLNRPERRNAVNARMHEELHAAIRSLARDARVRALVITGTGTAFCAGQDLTEFTVANNDPSFRVDEHVRATFNRLVASIRALEMPVICGVNGVAAGAGWSLALAADIRIAADSCRFAQGFARIGLVPDTGSTWLLTELIGTSRTLQLAYTGDPIDAQLALAWGLVNEVVPASEVADRAATYAARVAGMPTKALAMTRRAVYRAATTTLDDALEYEAQLQQHAAASDDHREGVTAFLEKREPVFTGR